MTKRYFGTDGIRGRVGSGAINPEFILKLGWAVGRVFSRLAKGQSTPRIIIGKDTRISGYMFESALEAGLCRIDWSYANTCDRLLNPNLSLHRRHCD